MKKEFDELSNELKIVINMFGDSLIEMEENVRKIPKSEKESHLKYINEVTERLELEPHTQKPWESLFLNQKEGMKTTNFAIYCLKKVNSICLSNKGEVRCSKKEMQIWRNLGTYALSAHLMESTRPENLTEVIGLLYRETRGEALFRSLIKPKDEGHALLSHVFSADGRSFDVRLYNTGLGSPAVQMRTGDKDREADDAFFKTFERRRDLNLEDLQSYNYFIFADETRYDIESLVKRAYPENRVYDKTIDQDPFHYSRQQRAGTCVATSLWAWLRSLGPSGVKMEIKLKGIVLENITRRYREIKDYQRPNPPPNPDDFDFENYADYKLAKKRYKDWNHSVLNWMHEHVGQLNFLKDEPSIFFALASNTINEMTEFLIWISSHENYRSKACSLYKKLVIKLINPILDVPEVMSNVSDIIYSLFQRSCSENIPPLERPERLKLRSDAFYKIMDKCARGKESSFECYEVLYRNTFNKEAMSDKLVLFQLERILEAWEKSPPSGAISTILFRALRRYAFFANQEMLPTPPIFEKLSDFLENKMNSKFRPIINIYKRYEWDEMRGKCSNPKFEFTFENAVEWAICEQMIFEERLS